MKTKKLHPAVKKKWVKALRSGEYKQAQGRLRDAETGGMCCLGVLCDIYGTDHKKLNGNYDLPASPSFPKSKLPKTCHTDEIDWKNLARMNDDGENFKTIANHIEDNL